MKKDIIIFGAGKFGRMALVKYGERVAYFMDNNKDLWGNKIAGIEIRNVEEGIKDREDKIVVIAAKYKDEMIVQLENLGINDYVFYQEDSQSYYEMDDLVYNPYLDNPVRDMSENDWNSTIQNSYIIDLINERVEKIYGTPLLFNHIEIETINRCNGICDFCPVSHGNDSREFKEMTWELFESIINQLAEMDYAGKIALFSNNEPFLDKTIIEKHRYAREKLPCARFHLFTNGTLLSLDKFIEIMKYLDELVIDNYNQELKLIPTCKEIADYCELHPELKKKVTIVLRKPHEVLTTRGGDAPNRKELVLYSNEKCLLPFKEMIVRPDGKVSLCCSDPLGKETLGDLSKESIMDVWNGNKFKKVRDALYKGRGYFEHCKYCDNFRLV